ncbi:MAG: methyltransferase domain-containing protein [Proteobacteria bacterium]|nr:methyltransferase domain-containing protein [Pseudomonadota bacterium]
MWNDVVDLRDFYATALGRAAQRMIRARLREIWPDLTGQRVLGIGFATPYLGAFRAECERVLAVMPAGQGVLRWPLNDRCLTHLADETELPFPDLSIDRILLVHSLECTERTRPMLREVWRVLADSGSLVVVAPNRRGLWARAERTPFGYGRPFSHGQLTRLLRENMFMPVRAERALFAPPISLRIIIHFAEIWERVGRRVFPGLAGVYVVEAVKQIYVGTSAVGEAKRKRSLAPVPLIGGDGLRRDGGASNDRHD